MKQKIISKNKNSIMVHQILEIVKKIDKTLVVRFKKNITTRLMGFMYKKLLLNYIYIYAFYLILSI